MVNEFFQEKYASAADAGLSFRLYLSSNAVSLYFKGYNEKMKTFVSDVMQDLTKIHEYFDESKFEVFRAKVANNFKNSLMSGQFSANLFQYIVTQDQSYEYDYYHIVNRVTFENIEKFADKIFKKLRIKMFIHGNMLKDEALSINNIVLNSFDAQPLDDVSKS